MQITRWAAWLPLAVTVAALLSGLLIWLSYGLTGPCSGEAAARALCRDTTSLDLSRGLNVVTSIGIALSAAGTFALIITVGFTALATRAAMKASDAALVAIEHARTSSIRELRPYFAVESYNNVGKVALKDSDERTAVYIEIRWQNVGQTPARNVRSRSTCMVLDGPLPANFDFPTSDGSDIVGTVGREKGFNAPTGNISITDALSILRREKSCTCGVGSNMMDSSRTFDIEAKSTSVSTTGMRTTSMIPI